MPIYDLFNDTAQLAKTVRGQMPYEVNPLTPKEVWGHGHGSTSIDCRQKWKDVATWIRYMVGEVKVQSLSGSQVGTPYLIRHIPEQLRYFGIGDGSDKRLQWCTGLSQIDQGGNPPVDTEDPSESSEPFLEPTTNWPQTAWYRAQAMFETTPYWVRGDAELTELAIPAGALLGARELLRYIVRDKKNYSKEQPIPAASTAGGFKDTTTGKPIGQVGFRVVSMADVVYKWIRVPVGWPPHPGWLITDPLKPWPPPVNPAVVAPGTKRPCRDTYVGTVNSTYFDVADPEGYNWQPEELLYLGYEEFKYFDAAGDRVADYTFRFKFKEGGWNKFLNARGEWVSVTLDGLSTGTKPYTSNNFNNLFQWSDV